MVGERGGGRKINTSVPASEDNDSVLTFSSHIEQTDKWEVAREDGGDATVKVSESRPERS